MQLYVHIFSGSISGVLHTYLAATLYHPSTVLRHGNNLYDILARTPELKMKRNVVLLADNGPDWMCPKSMTLQLHFGRLFRELKLDSLIVAHYAAYHSKHNYIERLWGEAFRHMHTWHNIRGGSINFSRGGVGLTHLHTYIHMYVGGGRGWIYRHVLSSFCHIFAPVTRISFSRRFSAEHAGDIVFSTTKYIHSNLFTGILTKRTTLLRLPDYLLDDVGTDILVRQPWAKSAEPGTYKFEFMELKSNEVKPLAYDKSLVRAV